MTSRPDPSVRVGFTSGVLSRILSPEVGLVIWRRLSPFNLCVTAAALSTWPRFVTIAEGRPEVVAQTLLRDLGILHWPVSSDVRRLGRRFSATVGATTVRISFGHAGYAACHPGCDDFALRLLCTYAGPGAECVGTDGRVRRLNTMEVAIFKGRRFPVPGPRVRHRPPALPESPPARRPRLVLCVDEVA